VTGSFSLHDAKRAFPHAWAFCPTMRKMDVLCSFATAAHPSRQKGRGKGTRVKSNVCSVGYKPVPLWNDLYAFKTEVYTAILIYSPLRPSKDWPPKT
jgi:hypothetical protein